MKKMIALLLLSALALAPAAGIRMRAEPADAIAAPDASANPSETPAAGAVVFASPEEMLAQWYLLGAMLRANGNYPFVKLERGDRGYEVVALQERLAQLNYYTKEISPMFGNGTYLAMRRFETVNGLKANGIASVEDQVVLFGPGALPLPGTTIRPAAATPAPATELPADTQVPIPEETPVLLPEDTPAPDEDEATLTPQDTPSAVPDETPVAAPEDNG